MTSNKATETMKTVLALRSLRSLLLTLRDESEKKSLNLWLSMSRADH
jgi:hypothetical protein